jgi:twitching motility protein PilT
VARIERLLEFVRKAGGSDLHLSVGSPPMGRVNGKLSPIHDPPLTSPEIMRLVGEILTEQQRNHFAEFHNLDFSYESKTLGRYRANLFRQLKGVDACFRAIPEKIPLLKDLRLPQAVVELAQLQKGLVLVTGGSGCGKSTTLAALISEINEHRMLHIVTLEDPIEFIYPMRKAIVSQRAVGSHTTSFARALRASLRQDPDVILVGELRDLETMHLAITAAETGHLVFATLNTASAHKTVDRIIGSFPADQHNQIRSMLSNTLRGIICQQLLPRADGSGRIAAFEILIVNKAIGNLIRENRAYQIPSIIQTASNLGWCSWMTA